MEAVKHQELPGIQQEIDDLRTRFPNTQDLYREVCVILFFRHGITPTANKLYQLVRKGSMSAPAEALTRFWADLREKSRVRLEHPDLPDELRQAAGELLGSLWDRAQAQARESFECQREALATENRQARERAQAAEAAEALLRGELAAARQRLDQQEMALRSLEQRLAGETAARQAMEGEIASGRRLVAELRQSADDARAHFVAELETARESHGATEARLSSSIRQKETELELERGEVRAMRQNLEDIRHSMETAAAAHRAEIADQANRIAELRQQLARMEGELKAQAEVRSTLTAELNTERAATVDLTHRLSAATREADRWQLKTIEAHREMEVLKAARLRKATRQGDPELDLGGPGGQKT